MPHSAAIAPPRHALSHLCAFSALVCLHNSKYAQIAGQRRKPHGLGLSEDFSSIFFSPEKVIVLGESVLVNFEICSSINLSMVF